MHWTHQWSNVAELRAKDAASLHYRCQWRRPCTARVTLCPRARCVARQRDDATRVKLTSALIAHKRKEVNGNQDPPLQVSSNLSPPCISSHSRLKSHPFDVLLENKRKRVVFHEDPPFLAETSEKAHVKFIRLRQQRLENVKRH